MHVAGRELNLNGKVYERGDSVAEASTWPPYIVRAHLSCGSLIEVTEEEARKMQDDAKAARKLASRQKREIHDKRVSQACASLEQEILVLEKSLKEKRAELARVKSMLAKTTDTGPDDGRPPADRQPDGGPLGGGAAVTAPPPPSAARTAGNRKAEASTAPGKG